MKFSILLSFLTVVSYASAFSSSSNDNVVLYWGQASAGSQETLGSYCQSDAADIYVISFLNSFSGGSAIPSLNIAGCETTFDGSSLLHCPDISSDIKYCQSQGKIVLLSLGGAVGSYGFSDDSDAQQFAGTLWNLFGGGSSDTRPFDDAIIDGFDLDIENNNPAGYAALVTQLRSYYSQDSSKSYYVSAAPQCVYPDANVGQALSDSYIDFAFIQFYNNPCGVDQSAFNWNTWKDFATNTSPNKNIKLFLGIPASSSAASSGYSSPEAIDSVVGQIGSDSSFGGIMMWDASQAFSNQVSGSNYAVLMKNAVQGAGGSGDSVASTAEAPSAAEASSVVAVSSAVVVSSAAVSSAIAVSSAPSEIVETSQLQPISSDPIVAVSFSSVTANIWTAPANGTLSTVAQATPLADSAAQALTTTIVQYEDHTVAMTAQSTTFVTQLLYVDQTIYLNTSTDTITYLTTYITVYETIAALTTSLTTSTTSLSTPVALPSTFLSSFVTSTAPLPSVTSTVLAVPSVAAQPASGQGSIVTPDTAEGPCKGKQGNDLSTCLNNLFNQNSGKDAPIPAAGLPSASGNNSTCSEGAVSCFNGQFTMCNFNNWVYFECAATTLCSALNVDGVNVVVGCNYASEVTQSLNQRRGWPFPRHHHNHKRHWV